MHLYSINKALMTMLINSTNNSDTFGFHEGYQYLTKYVTVFT